MKILDKQKVTHFLISHYSPNAIQCGVRCGRFAAENIIHAAKAVSN